MSRFVVASSGNKEHRVDGVSGDPVQTDRKQPRTFAIRRPVLAVHRHCYARPPFLSLFHAALYYFLCVPLIFNDTSLFERFLAIIFRDSLRYSTTLFHFPILHFPTLCPISFLLFTVFLHSPCRITVHWLPQFLRDSRRLFATLRFSQAPYIRVRSEEIENSLVGNLRSSTGSFHGIPSRFRAPQRMQRSRTF